MKTKRYLNILCAVAAVSAALILSCEQLDGPSADGVPAGEGRVALTISTGGAGGSALRTILPKEDPEFTRYDLIFTPYNPPATGGGAGTDGDPLVITIPADEVKDDEFNQVLAAGSWKVDVKAYRKSVLSEGGEKEYLAAKGTTRPDFIPGTTPPTATTPPYGNITISGGKLTPVTVELKPFDIGDPDEGEGVFSFKVTYPIGTGGTLTISDGTDDTPYLLKDKYDPSAETPITENVTELTVGATPKEYTLTIALYTGGVDEADPPVPLLSNALRAGTQAALYIYSGLESSAEFEFTDEDFISEVLVPLTSPTLPEGFELNDFLITADPNAEEPVWETVTINKATGSLWYAPVPAKYVGGPVYFKKTGDESQGGLKTTYEATVEIDPLPERVSTDEDIDISVTFSGTGTGPEVTQAINNVSGSGKIYLDDGLTFTTYEATLNNDVTVTGTVTIGSGADITLSSGTLTVAPNGTFKVDGSFKTAGADRVEIAQATVTGGNIYTVPSPKPLGWVDPGKTEFDASSGTLTINGEGGSISLTDGGAIKVTGSGSVTAGNVTLTKAASASFGTFTARITGEATDAISITAGKNIAGIAFVKASGDGYGAILAADAKLTVAGPTEIGGVGGTLTVGEGAGIANGGDSTITATQETGTSDYGKIVLAYGASYLNSVGPSGRPATQYDYNWDPDDPNSTVTVTYNSGTSELEDITFTGALSPAPGNISSTLTIPVGATLTVPADRTVTLTGLGSIEVDGTLQVDGGVKVTNTDGIVINRGGKVTVGSTGSLEGTSYNFAFTDTDKTLAASYSGFTLGDSSIGGTLVLNATQVLNVTGGTSVTGTLTVLDKVNFTPNISLDFTNGTVIVGNPSTNSVTLTNGSITSADKITGTYTLYNNTALEGTSGTVTLTGNAKDGNSKDTLQINVGGGIRITGAGKIITTTAEYTAVPAPTVNTTFTVSGKSKWTVSTSAVTLTAASTSTGATGLSGSGGIVLVENGELTVAGKLDVNSGVTLTVDTLLTLSGTSSAHAEVTVNGTLTVAYARTLSVPDATTSLTVGSGGTLNVYGTADMGAGKVKLTNAVISGSADLGADLVDLDTGGSLKLYHSGSIATAATGKVTANATTFAGTWQALIGKASATDTGKYVNIDSTANGATITGNSASDTPVLTAGTGAAITQAAGSSSNALTLTTVTVNLAGTGTAAAGEIKLVSGTNPGKLEFSANTAKVLAGAGADGSAIAGLKTPTIGGKVIVITGLGAADFQNDGNTKLVQLGGSSAGSFTASTTTGQDVVINSTVAAAGSS